MAQSGYPESVERPLATQGRPSPAATPTRRRVVRSLSRTVSVGANTLVEAVRRWDHHAGLAFRSPGYRLIRAAVPVEQTKYVGAFQKVLVFTRSTGISLDEYLAALFTRWEQRGRSMKYRPFATALGGAAYNKHVLEFLKTEKPESLLPSLQPVRRVVRKESPIAESKGDHLRARLESDVTRYRLYANLYRPRLAVEYFWLHFVHHFSGEFLALNLEFRSLDFDDLLRPEQKAGYMAASNDPAIRARVSELLGELLRAPVGEGSCRDSVNTTTATVHDLRLRDPLVAVSLLQSRTGSRRAIS
jgi:hypothetical protein